MNVLYISHSLLMSGGANRSMMQLIVELRNNYGVKPIVLAPLGKRKIGDHGLIEECVINNIPYVQSVIPWFVHSNIWLHRIKYVILYLYYPFLVHKLRKYNITLIHSNGSVFDLGAKLSNSIGVPHIWHLREFGTENEKFRNVWGERFSKRAFKNARAFIAISDAIKTSFADRIDENRIYRIYNGIDRKKYHVLSNHSNDRIEFAIVGAVTPHKNQLEAIKALSLLVDANICNFHLNIIGPENKEYGKKLRDFVNKKSLDEFVTFWGLRNDVPDMLAKMDVGLMLSKSEAFGRVTVEYMFQNLAVIASDTGANVELIIDGKTGFLYHYGNEIELSDKMKMIIENHALLCDISRRGHEYAMDNFPSDKNSLSVYKLYQKVLNISESDSFE